MSTLAKEIKTAARQLKSTYWAVNPGDPASLLQVVEDAVKALHIMMEQGKLDNSLYPAIDKLEAAHGEVALLLKKGRV